VNPPLTADAVRDWVGDHEIGKGRPYAEGPAVVGCARAGDVLRASVKGTRTRPYRVRVVLGGGRVTFAECTCPVGYLGKCKHVAAVLLAYLESPPRFVEVPDPDANLATRDKPELVALVKAMLRRAPELEPLLARPLPGFSAAGPSAQDFYYMAIEAIRAAAPHDELTPYEIAAGLRELVEYAGQFGPLGPDSEAFSGIARALADEGFDGARLEEVLRPFPPEVSEALAAARPAVRPTGPGEPLPF